MIEKEYIKIKDFVNKYIVDYIKNHSEHNNWVAWELQGKNIILQRPEGGIVRCGYCGKTDKKLPLSEWYRTDPYPGLKVGLGDYCSKECYENSEKEELKIMGEMGKDAGEKIRKVEGEILRKISEED